MFYNKKIIMKKLYYILFGTFSAMTSWYYYHNIILLIISWAAWPLSLLYFILSHKYANGEWLHILQSYF